jgi:hypothetical protein
MSEGLEFYRCTLCHSVVSIWDIREKGKCRTCSGVRIMPTDLSLWEKIVQIVKHPKIWEWHRQSL